jgi:hypothetical protein
LSRKPPNFYFCPRKQLGLTTTSANYYQRTTREDARINEAGCLVAGQARADTLGSGRSLINRKTILYGFPQPGADEKQSLLQDGTIGHPTMMLSLTLLS